MFLILAPNLTTNDILFVIENYYYQLTTPMRPYLRALR